MKKQFIGLAALAAMCTVCLTQATQAASPSERWTVRLDFGGTIPEDAEVTELDGPVADTRLKMDPGFQLDIGLGYSITPWLEIGPELGFTFNFVDSIGDWSYPDTTFGQILMFANVRLEYPTETAFAPFVGAGIGGVASYMTFGAGDYYYGPDGTGDDFALGFQGFAGVRYRMGQNFNIGLVYRYLFTDRQHWEIEWWDGGEFGISADSTRMHSICLVLSGRF